MFGRRATKDSGAGTEQADENIAASKAKANAAARRARADAGKPVFTATASMDDETELGERSHKHQDRYGFRTDDPSSPLKWDAIQEYLSHQYAAILMHRSSRWMHIYVRDLPVLKGVPSDWRAPVWLDICGATVFRQQNPNLYAQLLVDSPAKANPILTALFPRTFTLNRPPMDPMPSIQKLRRVLVAYAAYDPEIGYCQGLNFIAAMLLLVLRDESDAFYALTQIIGKDAHLAPRYHVPSMAPLLTDLAVAEELVRLRYPEIHDLFVRNGVTLSLIATKWFICMFIDSTPPETTMRIWDSFLYEGSKVLFRVTLALIQIHHQELLRAKDMASFFNGVKNSSLAAVDCHHLMDVAFNKLGTFRRSLINALREELAAPSTH
ncbi:hypothetical protein CAOG_08661 [Capsaspora owczarzaki ATCC 30864]|uniref:Rab-GAP TBC domain-containing protein n=1 Tax=Capsaspora owczarzaki (strain ATCC 30864) TaxID=595528 RepID=A0A0D2X262_CAPO3|nr:hypothetical protein CAOG_08661 [Capsaspora owczarzaki ATCC 30864]KJE92004.1 hypothetical protein CAOG_008661 [Capsaspora owczarzaki ATCC 30864]|eukprot:XP_011270272.1 hypothetical protein CAOG_08661 [Capsaspora owczarzaki ATCC 30864]